MATSNEKEAPRGSTVGLPQKRDGIIIASSTRTEKAVVILGVGEVGSSAVAEMERVSAWIEAW